MVEILFLLSLCFIDDIIEGMIKMMNSPQVGPFNFGHYEEIKMIDIAKKIISMTESKSKIIEKKSLLFMTPLGLPDIDLAKKKLGWYPLISLEDGLNKTIEYVRANQNILQPMLWKYDDDKEE